MAHPGRLDVQESLGAATAGVDPSRSPLVNLQRQLATPIHNACFSHEFADMLHLLQVFESLSKPCNALQYCKVARNRPQRVVTH